MAQIEFPEAFERLTGHSPFPWQSRLYELLVAGQAPAAAGIPTGLGKTMVIAVWLIAVAVRPRSVPRRLAYVVNRRTVVDQSTAEAERLRESLKLLPELHEALSQLCAVEQDDDESPLAISSLRGAFADNRHWLLDPARPAIVVGTVDMIGSRLLFEGYRCGFKSRPMHAAWLGQDSLIVHDEAHLEPAFQELLCSIQHEQRHGRFPDGRPLRVIELTATSRGSATGNNEPESVLSLEPSDLEHSVVCKRMNAAKAIRFHAVEDAKAVPNAVVAAATEHIESGNAVLAFVRRVTDVDKVVSGLQSVLKQYDLPASNVEQLTGTLRGWERDRLATGNRLDSGDSVFARFLQPEDRGDGVIPAEGTVFLVCTSAGEVGVNISADHLVCDLTPLDSMAQRLGRVNRFGNMLNGGGPHLARVDVVHEEEIPDGNPFDNARRVTRSSLDLLRSREDGTHDGSPAALRELFAGLTSEATKACFSPEPDLLPVSEFLFDAWSMTTIRSDLPGRPPVADWLHGVAEWEPPETYVAWREEVDLISDAILGLQPSSVTRGDLLEAFPLKPHELLRDTTDRVFAHLQKLAARSGENPVWIVDENGTVKPKTLAETVINDDTKRLKEQLQWKTIILGPKTGGIAQGLLNGRATATSNTCDVSEEWCTSGDEKRQLRVFDNKISDSDRRRMRRSLSLILRDPNEAPDAGEIAPDELNKTLSDETSQHVTWDWYVLLQSADDDALSWQAPAGQLLVDHLELAGSMAERFGDRLDLEPNLKTAVRIAARFHDLGKDRRLWQLGIGNTKYSGTDLESILAKSNRAGRPLNAHYRHEFGTLLTMTGLYKVPPSSALNPLIGQALEEFSQCDDDTRDLILHLIAAHHGRARPHFPSDESFDPDVPDDLASRQATETMQRFARLQRRFGRWGLAWLESLVRASDYAASSHVTQRREANET